MKIEQELYLNAEELMYEIENTSGLKLLADNGTYLKVEDTLENNQRKIRFNKENFIVTEDIIEDFGEDISKYRLVECLQMLPKILLMNLKNIYVVSTSEHLAQVEDITNVYTFDLYNKGMYIWETGDIIISLVAHEEEAELTSNEELDSEGQTDYDENLRILVWRTLARELFHSLQSNPLFESDIEQGEEVVDDFCELYFTPTYA